MWRQLLQKQAAEQCPLKIIIPLFLASRAKAWRAVELADESGLKWVRCRVPDNLQAEGDHTEKKSLPPTAICLGGRGPQAGSRPARDRLHSPWLFENNFTTDLLVFKENLNVEVDTTNIVIPKRGHKKFKLFL